MKNKGKMTTFSLFVFIFLQGCTFYTSSSTDPTERGLTLIANAIISVVILYLLLR